MMRGMGLIVPPAGAVLARRLALALTTLISLLLALAPLAPAAQRPAVHACLETLVARTRALGPERLALTERGVFFGNEVFQRFVPRRRAS